MHNPSYLLIFLLLVFTACDKSANKSSDATALIGKWTYTERYYSIGGPGGWHPVETANQVIEFKSDGSFKGAPDFLPGATSFEIIDSAKLKFGPASLPAGNRLMRYDLKSAHGALILYPVDPVCIEGCSDKFVRR